MADVATLKLTVDARELVAETANLVRGMEKLGAASDKVVDSTTSVERAMKSAARAEADRARMVAEAEREWKRANAARQIEAERNAAESAKAQARAAARALQEQFALEQAHIKAAQARGLLTPQEAHQAGRDAGLQFNQGMVAALDKLQTAGITGGKDPALFTELAGSLKNVDEAARASGLGLGRLNQSMASLMSQAAGVNPVMGRLTATIGSVAMGSAFMLPVMAGLAAMALAWRSISAAAKEAEEQLESARRTLQSLNADPLTESVETVRAAIKELRHELRRLEEAEAQSVLAGGISKSRGALRIEQIKSEYAEMEAEVSRGEASLAEHQRREEKSFHDRLMALRAERRREEERRHQEHWDKKIADLKASLKDAAAATSILEDQVTRAGERAIRPMTSNLETMARAMKSLVEGIREARGEMRTLGEITDNSATAIANVNRKVQEVIDSYFRMGYSPEGATDALKQVNAILRDNNIEHDQLIERLQKEVELLKIQAGLVGGMPTPAGGGVDINGREGGAFFAAQGGIGAIGAAFLTGGVSAGVTAVLGALGRLASGLMDSAKNARAAAEEAMKAAQAEAAAAEMRRRARLSFETDIAERRSLLGVTDPFERERVRAQAELVRQLAWLQQLTADGMITVEEYWDFWSVIFGEWAERMDDIQARQDATAQAIQDDLVEALREAEEAARRAAEATRQLYEDLEVRALRAAGATNAADMAGLTARHRRERDQYAGESADMRDMLRIVQDMEVGALVLQQGIGAIRDNLELTLAGLREQQSELRKAYAAQDKALVDQIKAIRDAARTVDDAFAEQIKTAKEALRTANQQLREQERTVEQLRRVADSLADFRQSLLVSALSPLSPTRQLEVARAQFDALARQALDGDVTAAQGIPGVARTFLDASRAVNASGVRYAADFEMVQAIVAQIEGRVGGQLSTEQQILSELKSQTQHLEEQIAELIAARETAAAGVAAQLGELEKAREQARAEFETQMAAIEAQMDEARRAADAQIAELRDQFEAARRLWEEQLAELREQVRLLQIVQDWREWINPPPPIEWGWDDLKLKMDEHGEATVVTLQAGFSTLSQDLSVLQGEVSGLRRDVRQGLETAV
jgi:hypothetical protein